MDPFGLSPLSILCEIGHGILMVLGFVPEWGFIADGLNAIWYAAEKKPFEAFCSAVSAIPGAGDKFAAWLQAGKIGGKVFKNTKLIKTISHLMGNIGSLCIAGVNIADSGDNLIKALKGEEYEGTILGNSIMLGLSLLSGFLSTAGIIKNAKDLGNLVKPKPMIGAGAKATTRLEYNLQFFAESPKGSSSSDLKTYYHVTTADSAKMIMETSQLKNGRWEAKVFAWSQQPTKKQASIAGISSEAATVIKFKTNASFTKDAGNADCASIKDIVLESSVGQRLPISITDIEIVGFKKEWWQFWKK